MYEHLYKAHLLRIQCANALIYMVGGGFFVGGSLLFFPAMEEIIYHGTPCQAHIYGSDSVRPS